MRAMSQVGCPETVIALSGFPAAKWQRRPDRLRDWSPPDCAESGDQSVGVGVLVTENVSHGLVGDFALGDVQPVLEVSGIA